MNGYVTPSILHQRKKNMSILIWSHMCTNILCNFKDNNLTPWHKKNYFSGMWVYLHVVEKMSCPLTLWFSLVSSNCHCVFHVPSCVKTESTGEPDSVANIFWNWNELWDSAIYEKALCCRCKTHQLWYHYLLRRKVHSSFKNIENIVLRMGRNMEHNHWLQCC